MTRKSPQSPPEAHPRAQVADTLDGLDRYRDVPTDVLARIVVRDCAAPLEDLDAESDVELAERICGACRAPLACVELELRLHGAETVGVWGGLPDDEIRAVCRGWLARRGQDYAPPEEPPGPMCARCDHSEWVHEAFDSTHAYVRPAPDLDGDRVDDLDEDAADEDGRRWDR